MIQIRNESIEKKHTHKTRGGGYNYCECHLALGLSGIVHIAGYPPPVTCSVSGYKYYVTVSMNGRLQALLAYYIMFIMLVSHVITLYYTIYSIHSMCGDARASTIKSPPATVQKALGSTIAVT